MTNSAICLSTDKSKLDVEKIHDYIANQSYWGKGRSLSQMQSAIDNSMCFGLYQGDEQIGFARVITDTVSVAYLLDVLVFEQYQGQGYGKQLIDAVLNHKQLQSVNWMLRTSDAHHLYEKFGFESLKETGTYMRRDATITR